MHTLISNSPNETIEIAAKLAKRFKPGTFVALIGDLGSGKTVFTKGIAKGLGVKEYKYVNSPSFVIIKEYKGKIPLYHFDVYRLKSSDDLETVGYEEYFYGKGVTVVEWADKIRDVLPERHIEVQFEHVGESVRKIKIKNKISKIKYQKHKPNI